MTDKTEAAIRAEAAQIGDEITAKTISAASVFIKMWELISDLLDLLAERDKRIEELEQELRTVRATRVDLHSCEAWKNG